MEQEFEARPLLGGEEVEKIVVHYANGTTKEIVKGFAGEIIVQANPDSEDVAGVDLIFAKMNRIEQAEFFYNMVDLAEKIYGEGEQE